ncbi:hypothetical protein SASPL_120083 [Salvia splendens]|uniref:ABC transporter domain-containing protein n=1 Tax=Salvia splendens TaxID=180675 RepID=A0A8X8XUR4_SALSN|nr:hypothetical protein SASPL_120083 [Salvia splendens]
MLRMRILPSAIAVALILVLGDQAWLAHAQDPAAAAAPADPDAAAADDPTATADNPAAMQLLSQAMFKRFNNFSAFFGPDVKKHLKFCIRDMDAEWDKAFNFSKNTKFLAECVKGDKGICYAAAVHGGGDEVLRAESCNMSAWPNGCEPGWSCNVKKEDKVDIKNDKVIPDRVLDCQPCCPGFFCPLGLTCMPAPWEPTALELNLIKPPVSVLRKSSFPTANPFPIIDVDTQENLEGTVINYLQGRPTTAVAALTCGLILLLATRCSVPEDSTVPPPAKRTPAPKDISVVMNLIMDEFAECYQLAGCHHQTENQNITAYGLIFFGGITMILLIIYNCSGQVLSDREKRQAKSREAAARSARETVQARERWKSAKDVARKSAELTAQLSRTFSRKKSVLNEPHKGSGQPKPGSDGTLPAMSGDSKGKRKKESNLTKMLRDLEENPDNDEGKLSSDVHLVHPSCLVIPQADPTNEDLVDGIVISALSPACQHFVRKEEWRGIDQAIGQRGLHRLLTVSQIFKYAYGQIEKEKQMQEQTKNMTFSGVISMASDLEFSSRPPIEVFFQDLTLTLKGKNKHLLRCVTGKLVPGHVSAVMGPSGAGKTTFLSALLGKAAGCTITGSILINGKNEPMQSYKRIIGYVPQDDIVHGNLTVEENLWFSARCRLAAVLENFEKVLVVERVIESLGLQRIRDSLVGTVEKRGISGGQRKRVNVGLEMVMEPSLLILDEPTSGLDSSSSLLLLRALHREALEGVNICMVVHQPRMFDDLILLAKGGRTVYHGPVKKVEDYFSGLGIVVPERVNPPDYYIDILEGIVKPSANAAVKFKELPLRWMLHNGYPVPPDMLDSAGVSSVSADDSSHGGMTPASTSMPEQSFAGDLWQDVKFTVGQKNDHIWLNFNRLGKQRLRESRTQAVDYLILLMAGICLGTLAKMSDETFGSSGYLYTYSHWSVPAHQDCCFEILFSGQVALLEREWFWHEQLGLFPSKGLGRSFQHHHKARCLSINVLFLQQSQVYHFLKLPGLAVSRILFLNISCVFSPPRWSVLLPVVLSLIANQDADSFASKIGDYCYTKWALEAFLLANAERYSGVWLIQRCGAIRQRGYDLKDYYPCWAYLIATCMFGRGVAFFCLVTFQKK